MRTQSRTLLAIAVAMALAAACSGGSSRSSPSGSPLVPVTKVTDGDTIHVTFLGVDERVRLIGIDTPEVPWYGGKGECFGVEAGLYARSRLSEKSVRLSFDQARRDRYGRLLAYVYLGGELFNLTLIRLGYATSDPVPPDTNMAAEFAAAERESRAARRGLWSACPSSGG
jgi:micrococcal nuclease